MSQFIELISDFTNCQVKISGNNTIVQDDKDFFNKLINLNDIVLGDFVMNTNRTQLAKYTRNYIINNIISLISSEKIIDSNQYDILSIFQMETWLFIILFLIFVSIFGVGNIKIKTFSTDFIHSIFDHFECLIKNNSKLINLFCY